MSAKEEERLRDMLRKVTGAWNKCEVRYEESQRLLYDAREELKTAQAVADGLQWQVEELRKLVHDAVAVAANVCISCPYYAECDILQDGTCIGEEKICERAEEMGIKVGL